MEFDYAIKVKKPIICFLYHNVDELTGSKIEKKEELQQKLDLFRAKAQEKHCKYWKNSEDLGGKVSRSLVQLKKKHPSDGWIPGKYAADEKLFRTLEALRNRIQELEKEKEMIKYEQPEEALELAQGAEVYIQDCQLFNKDGIKERINLEASWDMIFKYTGSAMIGECTEEEFREKIQLVYWHSVPYELREYNSYAKIVIYHIIFDAIKIQLQALGLITYGTKKRIVSNINTYWKLTPYGEKYLLKVSAIRSVDSDIPF